MLALSLAYSEEEERLARSVGNLGATVVLLGARGMNCGPWRTATMRIRRIKKQFIDGPGSGRNRLARRLRIWLSNSCQEAIARSKLQPFQVSMQGQLVMLGFIPGCVKTGAMEGSCSSIRASAARGEAAAQERTCAVLSLIGSASPGAPKVLICAAVLAIGKVTLLSVG